MFTRLRGSLQKLCSEFKRNSEGSVVATFALSMVPVVGLVGAAVDYSAASTARTKLQTSLDAALLAGAKDGTTSWETTALNAFNANLKANFATSVMPTFQLTSTRAYTGTVTATVPSNFLGVLRSIGNQHQGDGYGDCPTEYRRLLLRYGAEPHRSSGITAHR